MGEQQPGWEVPSAAPEEGAPDREEVRFDKEVARRDAERKEKQAENLLRELYEARERETEIDEVVKKMEAGCFLPRGAAEIISKRVQENRADGMSEEAVKRNARNSVMDLLDVYYDQMFGIPNFSFLKMEFLDLIEKGFLERREGNERASENTAIAFFDVNGLKAVNDHSLGKHNSGDLFLEGVSDVFNGGRTVRWLEEKGIIFHQARKSGDEFMCVISADRSLVENSSFKGVDGENVENRALGEYIVEKIQEDFENLDMKKVQDFSDPKQREVYKDLGIDVESWPPDFKFKASASAGIMTVAEALEEIAQREDEKRPGRYEGLVLETMKRAIDEADKRMTVNKKADKEARANSEDPHERYLEEIYLSGRSDMEMKREIEKLQEENKQQAEELEKLRKEKEEDNREKERLQEKNEKQTDELEKMRREKEADKRRMEELEARLAQFEAAA
jgi:GGDEF domain-containing protein